MSEFHRLINAAAAVKTDEEDDYLVEQTERSFDNRSISREEAHAVLSSIRASRDGRNRAYVRREVGAGEAWDKRYYSDVARGVGFAQAEADADAAMERAFAENAATARGPMSFAAGAERRRPRRPSGWHGGA